MRMGGQEIRRQTIAEKDVIICRCEEITEEEISKAIAEGCDSVIWVKRKTRALIAEETNQDLGQVMPDTRRPPLRPIPLDILEEREKK
jgi:hypothetical protein